VDNLRNGFDYEMNKAMNAAPDGGPAIEVFHWYFASLVALQNQIIRLYATDLKDTKTYLDQLGQIPPGSSTTFNNPMLNGRPLDHCLSYAAHCDKPAADEFCRRNGFQKASGWNVAPVAQTNIPSGQKCDAPSRCDAFISVVCE
jgi:hypothetical protein